MAKILGNDYRLFVESTTAGTYNQILGQGSLKVDRKAGSIDISDKNSAPYGLKAPGNIDVQVTCEGVVDLPDTTGLDRLDTIFKARNTVNFQIRNGALAPADSQFQCSMYIQDLSIDFGKDAAASYAITLTPAAAPTTDLLFQS